MRGIKSIIGGIFFTFLILSIVFVSIFSLIFKAENINFSEFLNDSYVYKIAFFSFYQAFLSTLISLFIAVFVSLSFYKRNFFLKPLLLKFFSITFVLPALLGVFGIVAIYGQNGPLSKFFDFNIYGLNGILLVHVFFNTPLAIRFFCSHLNLIDTNSHKLSVCLNLNAYYKFKYLEWPIIIQEIPQIASLIFMLCFTSFAIVMALGGGPNSTTLEVAIYQALKYDFELDLAAFLAILQIMICVTIALIMQKFYKKTQNQSFHDKNDIFFIDSIKLKIFDFLIIFGISLFILPPILSIIYYGINAKTWLVLVDPKLIEALKYSLLIASLSGILSFFMAFFIVLASRELKMRAFFKLSYALELSSMIVLIIPSIIISTGLFIVFYQFENIEKYAYLFVIFINCLIALPFIIRSLTHSFFSIEQKYKNLCLSLNIDGLFRLFIVEFKALKKPFSNAIALSFLMSLGDFSAISLFGNEEFITLPMLLFNQMSAYKMQESSVTALVLLLFTIAIFMVVEFLIEDKNVRS